MSAKRKAKRNRWTAYEDEWLRNNHPVLGHKKGFEEFCKVFGDRHPLSAYMTRTSELGIKVTAERWREACQNNGKHENAPIGTIQKRGRGQNWIKVSKGTDGWVPYAQYLMKPKSDEIVVHIDGDKSNDDISNLRIIKRSVCARMSKQRFWSEEPIITETGIICCELEQALYERRRGTKCR